MFLRCVVGELSRWVVAARALFLRRLVGAQALFKNLAPGELATRRPHASLEKFVGVEISCGPDYFQLYVLFPG